MSNFERLMIPTGVAICRNHSSINMDFIRLVIGQWLQGYEEKDIKTQKLFVGLRDLTSIINQYCKQSRSPFFTELPVIILLFLSLFFFFFILSSFLFFLLFYFFFGFFYFFCYFFLFLFFYVQLLFLILLL